jgi:hypothetical protein
MRMRYRTLLLGVLGSLAVVLSIGVGWWTVQALEKSPQKPGAGKSEEGRGEDVGARRKPPAAVGRTLVIFRPPSRQAGR